MTQLSIVVPVYRVEPWIERCLSSIVNDPCFASDCELIIVDDGSPDKSIQIAERVCAGYSQVRFLRQANQGLGAARNAGAAAVRGAYMWFIDSDDWLTDGGVTRVLRSLRAIGEIDVLNLGYVMSNGRHSEVPNCAEEGQIYSGLDYLARSCVQNPVQYYVWSTAFYRANGLSFERGIYHEDALFTPVALYLAERVSRLAHDCYVYNLREGSIMSSGNYVKHASDMVRILDRLEEFRLNHARTARGARILAAYSALAVGAIYYYWNRLDKRGKAELSRNLAVLGLLRPVVRSGRLKYLKYLYAIIVMWWSKLRFASAAA